MPTVEEDGVLPRPDRLPFPMFDPSEEDRRQMRSMSTPSRALRSSSEQREVRGARALERGGVFRSAPGPCSRQRFRGCSIARRSSLAVLCLCMEHKSQGCAEGRSRAESIWRECPPFGHFPSRLFPFDDERSPLLCRMGNIRGAFLLTIRVHGFFLRKGRRGVEPFLPGSGVV